MTSTNTRKRGLVAGGIAALLVAGMATGGALVTQNSTIFDNMFGTTSESTDFKSELVADGHKFNYLFDGGAKNESTTEYFNLTNNPIDADEDGENLAVKLSIQPHAMNKDVTALFSQLDVKIKTDGVWTDFGKLDELIATADAGKSIGTVKAGETNNIGIQVVHADADGFGDIDRPIEIPFDLKFDASHV
jgi:hypothetical protein